VGADQPLAEGAGSSMKKKPHRESARWGQSQMRKNNSNRSSRSVCSSMRNLIEGVPRCRIYCQMKFQ
jgi:hypothetical protein